MDISGADQIKDFSSHMYMDQKMKIRKLLLILSAATLIIMALFGLTLAKREQTALDCLKPHLVVIPSPMPQKNPRTVTFGPHLEIPIWWKPQLNAEQQAQYEDIMNKRGFYAALDMLVYDNQVWIAHDGGVVRFDATHNIIKTYRVQVDSLPKYYRFSALYLRNGEIWAILSSSISVLVKYDVAKDEFIIAHDKDNLLNHVYGATVDGKTFIGELSDGKLIFVLSGEIFSYNPENQEAKKLSGLKTEFRLNTIAVAKDDSIWFTTMDDYVIRSLNPLTSQVKEYGEPPSLVKDNANQTGLARDSLQAITIDNQGRIWVGYFDRLEPDKSGNYTWREIKRSPILVDDTHIYDTYDRAVYVYKWTPVFSVAQFSDRNMWFVTGVGAVWYDASKDNWCWSSTQSFPGDAFSPIAEDENGNVWMVDYDLGQIYKLER
ncbi:MAG: hypothetical protein HYZ25_19480 [Chloroflexi bacterium]|nr:hypothetical protein [Chloroflexota bacterium]